MRSRMVHPLPRSTSSSLLVRFPVTWLALLGGAFALLTTAQPAFAIGTTVGLGTAASYSVLGGQSVTNTGPSVLSSNLGVNPGTTISGLPPGTTGGVIHTTDAHALQAQADLTTAYNDAADQHSDAAIAGELGGLTLTPGVYTAPSSTQITGPLTLDAQGDPDAVFIFQIGSALTTASSSSVVLLNDAQSCHVFWQVGSSATLGTGTSFVGTIMALTSITANTGATVEGRALARNGSVTLDTNVFTDVKCATTSTIPPTSPAPTATGTATATTSTPPATATPTASDSATVAAASVSGGDSSGGVSASGNSPSGDSAGGPLAYTGGGLSGPLIAIAVAATLLGLTLVLAARRRRTV